jgi:hypothetical protein
MAGTISFCGTQLRSRHARGGPGPRRQALWVGSGSACKGGSRRCFLRSGLCGAVRKDLRVPCGWRGRAGQCAAFRPQTVTSSQRSAHLARCLTAPTSSRRASPGTLRRGPVAAGGGDAARSSRRGRRARVRRTRRSCRPAMARPPAASAVSPGSSSRPTGPRLLAPACVRVPARRAWRAEGAPLKP